LLAKGPATIRDAGGGRRARGVRVLGARRAEGIGDVPGVLAPCAVQEKLKSTLKEILARGLGEDEEDQRVNELAQPAFMAEATSVRNRQS
jgi:hypothetical protein